MVQVIFEVKQQKTEISAELNEHFKDVCNKFIQKAQLNSEEVFFLVKGKLNPDEAIKDLMGNEENNNLLVQVGFNNMINEQKENNELNSMTLIYEVDKNAIEIKLFDYNFVQINMDNCYLLINNSKLNLCSFLSLDENIKKENILIVKIIETKPITDMSFMFRECKKLKALTDISKWDTKNVSKMRYMFSDCASLEFLPGITKWNTGNVQDMGAYFFICKSLKSLPDISKWDTKNVKDMTYIFGGCSSLISLPDISLWDTRNVNNMIGLFYNCSSLKSLPDISK